MIAWPQVEHRYLQLAAGRLHYVEAGRGDPVILLHGGHGSWTHWVANIAALSRAHRDRRIRNRCADRSRRRSHRW